MSTVFPNSLDSFPNPTSDSLLRNPSPDLLHSAQHANANDAIEAIETKIGIEDSTDPDSLDYKLRNGAAIRRTSQVNTGSLNTEAIDSSKTLPLGKGCTAVNVATDHPAWVRIYASAAAQAADASREITTDPKAGEGILLEAVTTSSKLEIVLSPAAVLFHADSLADLPMTVTNKDTVPRTIQVTITTVPFEG